MSVVLSRPYWKRVFARSLRVVAKIWYGMVVAAFVLMQVASHRRTGALIDQFSIGYIAFMVLLLSPGLGADWMAGRIDPEFPSLE